MMTTQQSYWEWSFLDKADSSCLICWNEGGLAVSSTTTSWTVLKLEGHKKGSYSLPQVCLHFHDEVERLEAPLQFVAVYVRPLAVVKIALGFKLHVVYDKAVSAWAGVHFIALMEKEEAQGKVWGWLASVASFFFRFLSAHLNAIPPRSAQRPWSNDLPFRCCGKNMIMPSTLGNWPKCC